MHRRYTAIRPAACATLLVLAAADCNGGGSADHCPRPLQQTIVFYDVSASSVADSATLRMFRDTLAGVVGSGLGCRGDAVQGFLVHGNTRGKVGRVDVVDTLRLDTLDMPAVQKSRAIMKYRQAMDSLRTLGEVRLTALLSAQVERQLRDRTDLLGTLEVISDEIEPVDTTRSIRVIYLGDMRESMPASRRDFDRRPPTSTAEAEAWADADTAVLGTMNIDRERLARVEVRVLLGGLANKAHTPEIRRYWERLFASAGIRRVQFN